MRLLFMTQMPNGTAGNVPERRTPETCNHMKHALGVVFLVVCSIAGDVCFQPFIRALCRRDETKVILTIKETIPFRQHKF